MIFFDDKIQKIKSIDYKVIEPYIDEGIRVYRMENSFPLLEDRVKVEYIKLLFFESFNMANHNFKSLKKEILTNYILSFPKNPYLGLLSSIFWGAIFKYNRNNVKIFGDKYYPDMFNLSLYYLSQKENSFEEYLHYSSEIFEIYRRTSDFFDF